MATRKNYTLRDYLEEKPGRAKQLCMATGISQSWLSQMKLGNREVPPMEAIAIDRGTGGLVRCETSCPKFADLFSYLRLSQSGDSQDPAAVE